MTHRYKKKSEMGLKLTTESAEILQHREQAGSGHMLSKQKQLIGLQDG